MIEKIVSIKKVGKFRDYNATGDLTFRRLTLIYAENGRGKTTLCGILRSLQTGRHEYITERRTIDLAGAPSVTLRVNGQTSTFTNQAWSNACPDISIFDSVFIHENVFAGDYVEHDHKKNLYRVIVGAQGVALAHAVDQFDAQIRDANADIRTKRDSVTRSVPQGTTIERFIALQPIADVDRQITGKREQIARLERLAARSAEVAAKGFLSKLNLPADPSELLPVLVRRLADVAADAETRIKDHDRNHLGGRGEGWLAQGVRLVAGENCPFCWQAVQGNQLIAAYRSYFTTAYRELKDAVAALDGKVSAAIGDAAVFAVQQGFSSNEALTEFWRQFTPIALPDPDVPRVRAAYDALRSAWKDMTQRKQSAPLDEVPPTPEYNRAIEELTAVRRLVDAYNSQVDVANASIREQKASAGAIDLVPPRRELSVLEMTKSRFDPATATACAAYQAALSAKAALDAQKQAAKDQLDQYCAAMLQQYEQSINSYLDRFNAGFRIGNTRHQYIGGSPSSQYHVVINGTAIELGDARTPSGTPCFKTTLSAGDRSAIALAFFLAGLDRDPAIANRIVVLDDPFTSLDRSRRICTEQLIRALATRAQQVVVLSHDPDFLKLIWDGAAAADRKALQFKRRGNDTCVAECDIAAETAGAYLRDHAKLRGYLYESKGDPRDVAKAIRPVLEGIMRLRFPDQFPDNEWLGDFIDRIRNAPPNTLLHEGQIELPEFEAINDYSKKYHHAQNPSADTEPIDDAELQGFVRRTIKVVGGF